MPAMMAITPVNATPADKAGFRFCSMESRINIKRPPHPTRMPLIRFQIATARRWASMARSRGPTGVSGGQASSATEVVARGFFGGRLRLEPHLLQTAASAGLEASQEGHSWKEGRAWRPQ